VLVDVPGLIEGASEGVGLGDRFLKHVERCRVLVHLVDGALSPQEALAQLATTERELTAWSPLLAGKRKIVAVSKQDLPDARETLAALKNTLDQPVFGISAATRKGVAELMAATYEAILEDRARAAADEQARGPVLRPEPKASSTVVVEKEPDGYRISGEKIERLAAMTDFETDDGRAYFDRVLARSGARKKLERLGVRPGDTIRVGDRAYTHS